MSILGYDIDGQPLRAGDRVVICGKAWRDQGNVCTVVGVEPDQHRYPGELEIIDHDENDKLFCALPSDLRKLPPKADHEPGSWEEIAKLGRKPNLAPSPADC